MPISKRNRKNETLCYVALWCLVLAFYILNDINYSNDLGRPAVSTNLLSDIIRTFGTFFVLFVINNFVLIPRLLLRNRYSWYFLATTLLIVVIWLWQAHDFMTFVNSTPKPIRHDRPRPPLDAFPLFLHFVYDLLTIGINLSTALIFRQYDDRLEQESLRKENAETQLTYLKGQINPHFYMNMLNNIHGMIEINPARAQDMVLDMSRLMRYMLYESSKPRVPLKSEVDFLKDYLQIMRQRYPKSMVEIKAEFPDASETESIEVPPLIFLVFIENSFKHGISYSRHSYVDVSLVVDEGTICFSCVNSVNGETKETSGIGLHNVRKRLALIYADNARLETSKTEEYYTVNLTIIP